MHVYEIVGFIPHDTYWVNFLCTFPQKEYSVYEYVKWATKDDDDDDDDVFPVWRYIWVALSESAYRSLT